MTTTTTTTTTLPYRCTEAARARASQKHSAGRRRRRAAVLTAATSSSFVVVLLCAVALSSLRVSTHVGSSSGVASAVLFDARVVVAAATTVAAFTTTTTTRQRRQYQTIWRGIRPAPAIAPSSSSITYDGQHLFTHPSLLSLAPPSTIIRHHRHPSSATSTISSVRAPSLIDTERQGQRRRRRLSVTSSASWAQPYKTQAQETPPARSISRSRRSIIVRYAASYLSYLFVVTRKRSRITPPLSEEESRDGIHHQPQHCFSTSSFLIPPIPQFLTGTLLSLRRRFHTTTHSLATYTRTHRTKSVALTLITVWLIKTITIDWVAMKRRQAVDATSEWGRYATRPQARGRALASLALLQIAPLWILSQYLVKPIPWLRNRYHTRLLNLSGRVLAQGLLKLGPLYIKLGQIISCRDDLLPDEWIRALECLQDQVPAKSGHEAIELAHQVWPSEGHQQQRQSFNTTFSHFDTTPIAAASLGQVHLATYQNQTVAIKLQRPYLRQIYDQDFQFLTKMAGLVDRFANATKGAAGQVGGIDQSWTTIFEDAETILYREIDYRDEAMNGLRFCRDFGLIPAEKKHKHNVTGSTPPSSMDGKPLPRASSWLRAPYVYEELSSEKVLVMEYVPSIKITNTAQLAAANVTVEEREYLAECLARAYLRQFCSHRFFSTDPHPGNLGVEILQARDAAGRPLTPEQRTRLVFYDFGQAATLERNQAEGILDIIEAIIDMDVERSVQSFTKMGVLKPEADLDMVRAKVADNYRTGKVKANRKRLKRRGYQFKQDGDKKAAGFVIIDVNATVTETTSNTTATSTDAEVMGFFTLPAEYAFVGRALSQMDGVGKYLDDEFDFISAAAPYLVEVKGAGLYIQDEIQKWFDKFIPRGL